MAEIAKASESRLRAELDSAKQRADHAKAQQEPGWEELVQQAQKLQEEFDNRHVGVGQVTSGRAASGLPWKPRQKLPWSSLEASGIPACWEVT